jgi:hypothetical protein
VDRGMESRGWDGARTNPVEEITINHFHSMLDRYVYQRIDRANGNDKSNYLV